MNAVNSAGSRLRGFIKTGAAHFMSGTGTDKVMGALAGFTNAPVVLGYHRVVEDFTAEATTSIPAMLISRSMLQRHLETMTRHYHFVSLDELAERRELGQHVHKPRAAITFDDGYSDFYYNAFPLLQAMGIPATVFVVTNLIGTTHVLTHDLLYRRLVRAFSKWRDPSRELAALLRRLDIEATQVERISSLASGPYVAMRAVYVTLPQAVTHRVLEALAQEVGTEETVATECRPLSWDMLRHMQGTDVNIGSHTRTHPLLINETRQTISDEVFGSKEDLERELGVTIRHFAYPGGYFRADIVRTVSDAGYRLAYTTCLHRDSDCPELTMPRKVLWENSCLDARGRFSSAVMGCKVKWSFDLFRSCEQDHRSVYH